MCCRLQRSDFATYADSFLLLERVSFLVHYISATNAASDENLTKVIKSTN